MGGYNSSVSNGGGSSGGESFSSWQAGGKDARSLVADPQFASLGTFALKPGAPAVTKLGFKPIDISKVGPAGYKLIGISKVGPAGLSGGVPGAAVGAFNARHSVSGVSTALGVTDESHPLRAHGLVYS